MVTVRTRGESVSRWRSKKSKAHPMLLMKQRDIDRLRRNEHMTA